MVVRNFPRPRRIVLFAVIVLALLAGAAARAQLDPDMISTLEWRLIGPFRGGRVTAVAGVIQDTSTFYMGATGGGVWKTEDGGVSWSNVSDGHLETGSVGAIAVAPSDPNVIYVGMGEASIRGVANSHGDGVYKSTDAGKSWSHLGLEETRHIADVVVHPTDPDVVYIAAQGYQGKAEPGTRHLSLDGRRGDLGARALRFGGRGSQLAGDRRHQSAHSLRRLLAAPQVSVESRERRPGRRHLQDRRRRRQLGGAHGGPPRRARARSASRSRPRGPQRVWAIVEAEEGGVFRSDDGGEEWKRVNEERVLRARAWYYTHIFADPQDPNSVWVLNAPAMRSIDGGKTFSRVRTPHGDNHDLWIHPDEHGHPDQRQRRRRQRLLQRRCDLVDPGQPADGTVLPRQHRQPVPLPGLRRPAGQLERLHPEPHPPRQRHRPRSLDLGRWLRDGLLAFDPDDPRYVYSGCYQGIIGEYDTVTGHERSVMAYEFLGLGATPIDMPYRFNWNAPIVSSPHDPTILYHAANKLLETTDRGNSWVEISPDLTRDEEEKQGPGGGPITNEAAGGENYNTILYVVESPHEAGTIWVGSDDGLVHLTRDGGESWNNVTPKKLPEAMINAIEVSPHDPAKAYLAVTRYKFGDYTPRIYRTDDYGALLEAPHRRHRRRGLGAGGARGHRSRGPALRRHRDRLLRLVRRRRQLAARSRAICRSCRSPISRVHGDDLVAATQGRAFWILDELTPLREMNDEVVDSELRLFTPELAYRVGGGRGRGNVGQNPRNGATLYYWLGEELAEDAELTLEILDDGGELVRSYSSTPDPDAKPDTPPPFGDPPAAKTLSGDRGLNRFVWDLAGEPISEIPDLSTFGSLDSYRRAPGRYTARLTLGETTSEAEIEVVHDPRTDISPEDFAEQQALLETLATAVDELHDSVNRLRDVRGQATGLAERAERFDEEGEIERAAEALTAAIDAWEEQVVQAKQETFQDVINFPNRLNADLLALMDAIDGSEPPVTEGARRRWADLQETLSEIRQERDDILGRQLTEFLGVIEAHEVPAIVVPED